MDGVTDSAFRYIVATYGKPDVVFTEFTNIHDICTGRLKALDSLRYSEVERPVIAQIYGKDPALFYQAAHVVCELGFDGLDINMGCPSKNVASSGSGAGLIRTPNLALELMDQTRKPTGLVIAVGRGNTIGHAHLGAATQVVIVKGHRVQGGIGQVAQPVQLIIRIIG